MSRNNSRKPTASYTTDMLETIYQAQKLLEYTIKILNNEKNFDPIYDDIFKDDFKKYAKDIYINLVDANEIYVGYDDNQKNIENFKERDRLQQQARRDCNKFVKLLTRSRYIYHIRSKRFNYWTGRIINLSRLIKAWNESDRKRCQDIINKKNMGQ